MDINSLPLLVRNLICIENRNLLSFIEAHDLKLVKVIFNLISSIVKVFIIPDTILKSLT